MADASSCMTGKVAWDAGSARRMGQAHAVLLAERSAEIVVHDIRVDEARDTAKRFEAPGRRVFRFRSDVASPEAMKDLVTEACKVLGKIDALVNNAGIGQLSSIEEVTVEDALGAAWGGTLGRRVSRICSGGFHRRPKHQPPEGETIVGF